MTELESGFSDFPALSPGKKGRGVCERGVVTPTLGENEEWPLCAALVSSWSFSRYVSFLAPAFSTQSTLVG